MPEKIRFMPRLSLPRTRRSSGLASSGRPHPLHLLAPIHGAQEERQRKKAGQADADDERKRGKLMEEIVGEGNGEQSLKCEEERAHTECGDRDARQRTAGTGVERELAAAVKQDNEQERVCPSGDRERERDAELGE